MGQPITFGVSSSDGLTAAWSREDADNNVVPGRFVGSHELIYEIVAVLILRQPVVTTEPNVLHHFPEEPVIRPVDVAAAMIAALQGSADTSKLRARFPELSGHSTAHTIY